MSKAYAVAELAVLLSKIAPKLSTHRIITAAEQLVRLEVQAHRFAEKRCNVPVSDIEVERTERRFSKRFSTIVNDTLQGVATFKAEFNGDPRGAGLKLHGDGLPGNTWGGTQAGYAVGVS